jgi:hypothetical protein
LSVFEFTQALRRQRRFLIVGGLLLGFAVFLMTFQVSSGGLQARIGPRYTTSVRMVVAPADTSSLGTAPTTDAVMAESASFFATLLTSPDAALQIEQASGASLDELSVTVEGVVITVATVAATPEDAVATATGAFDWITSRIDEPLEANAVAPAATQPSLVDSEGRLSTGLVVDASPAFATDGLGLWVNVVSEGDVLETVSLADAALEAVPATAVAVPLGADLTIHLEDVDHTELDHATLEIPPLPGPDSLPYELVLRIDRGSLTGLPQAAEGGAAASSSDLSDVEMQPDRIQLSWRRPESTLAAAPVTPQPVGLVLLTEDPIPLETGARRGPMIFLGGLLGGAFALVCVAIAIDGWRQAYRSQASLVTRTRFANIHPIRQQREVYRAHGPLSSMVSAAPDRELMPTGPAGNRDPE